MSQFFSSDWFQGRPRRRLLRWYRPWQHTSSPWKVLATLWHPAQGLWYSTLLLDVYKHGYIANNICYMILYMLSFLVWNCTNLSHTALKVCAELYWRVRGRRLDWWGHWVVCDWIRLIHAPEACVTAATWRCRKPLSTNGSNTFKWKLHCHWLKKAVTATGRIGDTPPCVYHVWLLPMSRCFILDILWLVCSHDMQPRHVGLGCSDFIVGCWLIRSPQVLTVSMAAETFWVNGTLCVVISSGSFVYVLSQTTWSLSHIKEQYTISQSPCTALMTGQCLPLGLFKATVNDLWKIVEIPPVIKTIVHCKWGNNNQYLDHPIKKCGTNKL